jgi:uncharacterized protein (DUF1697 family)
MKTHIALLRGINVGGNNVLPMKALVAMLQGMGAQQVRTYIQSGNAVFQHAETSPAHLSGQLAAEIRKHHGFEPHILILGLEAIQKAIADNPFPEAEIDPASLHLGFLASMPPNPDLDQLTRLRKESERFQLGGKVFYLYAPEGVGRSRLAANSEKALGVPMTDRNWRTVCKISDLAGEECLRPTQHSTGPRPSQ